MPADADVIAVVPRVGGSGASGGTTVLDAETPTMRGVKPMSVTADDDAKEEEDDGIDEDEEEEKEAEGGKSMS